MSSTEALYDSDSPVRSVSEAGSPTPSRSISHTPAPALAPALAPDPAPVDPFFRIRSQQVCLYFKLKITLMGSKIVSSLHCRATADDRVINPGPPPPVTLGDGITPLSWDPQSSFWGSGGHIWSSRLRHPADHTLTLRTLTTLGSLDHNSSYHVSFIHLRSNLVDWRHSMYT